MATKLYPPIIEETLPAFYKKNDTYTLSIPFEMNKTVGYTAVSGFALKLRTILGGASILVNTYITSSVYDQSENKVIFTIKSSDIATQESQNIYEGQFYKAQIAYIANDNTIGYYSTVGIIKCVEKPTVIIEGYSNNIINIFANTYIGRYTQNSQIGDCSEKVYSYRFDIYDKDHNLFATSGEQIHDASQDESENFSIDKFILRKTVSAYEVYYVQYTVTTVNKLYISSPLYHISAAETLDIKNAIEIIPTNVARDGYILIYFKDSDADYTGMYLLSRSSDNGITWDEIERFEVTSEEQRISTHMIRDNLIEQGKTYIYSLQEFNQYNVFTNRILSKPIYADYEDIFLQDKDRILKIRFNPKMNSFKNDIPEQKVETIGSKYPFIFRNGNVYYKEFPLGGLLSFQLDNALDFLTEEEQQESGILEEISHRKYTGQLNYWQQTRVDRHLDKDIALARISNDLVSLNIYTERYFKLKVLEWLNNGKPKLFRSPTEGLYIIRLLNVSLSPEEKLGRMLHNFSSTAYEIAELNSQNLIDFNLTKPFLSQVFTEEQMGEFIFQKEMTSMEPDENGQFSINNLTSYIKKLDFIDFCPGDKIILEYTDGTSNTFMIGATHELHCVQEDRIVTNIKIQCNNSNSEYNTFSRTIQYIYDKAIKTDFDEYANITTMALPCLSAAYHDKTIVYDINNWENIDTSNQEAAVFSAEDFGTNINNISDLRKCLGYSFYLDSEHLKPKVIIKHIDQIIVTKRQIVPVYRYMNSTTNEYEYLLDVFGKGFLNDRSIMQTKTIKSHTESDEEIEFNRSKTGELSFNQLKKKNGTDVFTFTQIMNHFQDDRFTILQIYTYDSMSEKWLPTNNYYLPFEGIGRFELQKEDWEYLIEGQEFPPIPNSFIEDLYVNTSTYTKVINIDRLNILVPSIKAGRGVCIDIVPQCLVYSYEDEESNSTIRELKQVYLEDKTLENLYNYLESLKEISS